MFIYSYILPGYQAPDNNEALEYANAICWSEEQHHESDRPLHSEYIGERQGVAVYYDYAADYYFFVELGRG